MIESLQIPDEPNSFAFQKESFCNSKGPLSKSERSPFEFHSYFTSPIYMRRVDIMRAA